MIVFASRTGNVRYVIQKLGLPNKEITKDLFLEQPYFLFTYTDGLGQIPKHVAEFLKQNHTHLKGVIVSGNTNFGITFCLPADLISQMYKVSIIRKIDLRGTDKDISEIKKLYYKIIEGDGN